MPMLHMIERITSQTSDSFYFLCAIPVVTMMSLAAAFSLGQVYVWCYRALVGLKSRQSDFAAPWLVQNHIISKATITYERLFERRGRSI